MKGNIKTFFKKRFSRILFPFILWSLFYNFYNVQFSELSWSLFFEKIINLFYKLSAHHLWYIYALLGIYMLVPIISPWIKSASKKELLFYLFLWAITLSFLYLKAINPFIEMNEWNSIFILYYFSGYLGYFIMGYYLIKHQLNKSLLWGFILIVLSCLIAFVIYTQNDIPSLLLTRYLTPNIAFLSIGCFLILKKVVINNKWIKTVVVSISEQTYGIYLIHIFILKEITPKLIDISTLPSILKTPVFSLITFVISYLIIKAIAFIPKSKYLIG
jgi:surface polysaccharide O-acyltransferase-like enzyme